MCSIMDTKTNNGLICLFCQKEFLTTSSKNRHIRKFHLDLALTKTKRIICPLCSSIFSYHRNLLTHLSDNHSTDIRQTNLRFRNYEEFTLWTKLENVKLGYANFTNYKTQNGRVIIFNCNRSNPREFVSNCKKRKMKKGGSIKMSGTCPSRIYVKITENGDVNVNYIQTHVGHDDEYIRRKLSKIETIQDKNHELPSKQISKVECIQKPNSESTSKISPKIEFIGQINDTAIEDPITCTDFNRRREMEIAELVNFCWSLSDERYFAAMAEFKKTMASITESQNTERPCKKIKTEEQ